MALALCSGDLYSLLGSASDTMGERFPVPAELESRF